MKSNTIKIDGRISFLVNEGGATIELHDEISNQTFAVVKLAPEQLCMALGRLYHTECDISVHCLDRVGKKMLMDKLEFEMPANANSYDKEIAAREASRVCPEGWTPDRYFGSKESFFRGKDGRNYARITIRKWVSPSETE